MNKTIAIIKIILRFTIWLAISLVLIFILVIALIQIPYIQNRIIHQATSFVSNKTLTKVEINRVSVSLTGAVIVKGLFLEDIKKDTLLYAGEAKLKVSIKDLLFSKISISYVELDDVYLNVNRASNDSLFNFNFLITAFSNTTKQKPIEPKSESNWTFNIDKVGLKNIRINFDDEYGGLIASLNLHELELDMNEMDLVNSFFWIRNLEIDNLKANILLLKSPKAKENGSEGALPTIMASKIQIKNSSISYGDSISKLNLVALVNKLELYNSGIDLQEEIVSSERVSLSKSEIRLQISDKELLPYSDISFNNEASKKSNWNVKVQRIALDDNLIAYSVANRPKIKNGFDVNHMEYRYLTLLANELFYSPLQTSVSVEKLEAIDKNNFAITKFQTDFSMDQQSISAKKLKIETVNSAIDADLSIHFSSLESIVDSLPFLFLNLDMKRVSVRTSEINYFHNQLAQQPFFQNKTNITTISGKIKGPLNNLVGRNLIINTGSSTVLKTDFVIAGLPDVETAYFNFPNLSLISNKSDIEAIAGSSIPKSIELPESVSLLIAFKGKIKSFESTVGLESSYGAAQLSASIDNEENFISKVNIKNFDLGRLLKDTVMFGTVLLTADASGKGLDFKTIKANLKANVSEIYLNKYLYHNLTVDGDINGKEFGGKISLKDENAAFDFDGVVNLNPNQEQYKFLFDLQGADLKKLNFTEDNIRIALKASADLKGTTVNNLKGKAGVSNMYIAKDEEIYELDSLLFASINESSKNEFNFSNALVGVKYSGTISPAKLVNALNDFINIYFPFSDNEQLARKSEPSNFKFDIYLKNHPILSKVLLPQLTEFEPGVIQGSFDSEKNDLKLIVSMKRIVYGTTEIKDFALDINSDHSALYYKIFSSAISNAQIKLDNFLIAGKIADNTILTKVSSISHNKKKKIEVHTQITKETENYKLTIDKEDFYLMHNRWDIAADNYIEFGKQGFLIHNFFINNAVSQININSPNNKFNDDLSIELKNFKLDDLSRIFEKDTGFVKGNVDGTVFLKREASTYGIIANAQVNNLLIREVPIGNLTLNADNPTHGRFDIKMNLSGMDNNLSVSGYLLTTEGKSSINLKTDIRSLSMKTVEAFSMGQISETAGTLSGNFLVTGAISAPVITGELVFNDAFLKPAFLNNRLEIKKETIQIKADGIYFDSFTILDSLRQTAIIDGSVKMKEFKDFVFAIRINTNNFQILNTTAKDNKEFFGRMIVDSRIDVNGPISLPVINTRVKVKNGSNFTFAVPESKLTTDRGEDVVEFEESKNLNSILYGSDEKVPQTNIFTGFDLSTIIEIDEHASLRLLLDPSTSDSLVVRGAAALSFSIDRSGKMSLTGAYHLNDGSYLVSLESIVKRRFDIIAGSTIIWNGDPLDAEISINAKYVVRAAPYDLLAYQMPSLSDTESSAYKQRYPFWIMLKLRGEILHPVISFQIQLPPEDQGILGGTVNQKLSLLNEDESALNKQVLALLVLGRFIQENPLQTESTGTSSLVRATVGKLLSEQINQLSSRLISGVELNVDIQSYDDYQTGQAEGRTQVELGVKKNLFNERLSIQVGGTVDVEGESAQENSASEITGDVKVEYKLTKDGRYRLKGFRHNQYEGAIEGQLVETGVGVAYVRDFNKWKNLFRRQRVRQDSTKVKTEN